MPPTCSPNRPHPTEIAAPENGEPITTGAVRFRQWVALSAAILLMAVCWLAVFPILSRWPAVQERNRRLDAKGVEPSATFYTDVAEMEAVEQRLQDLQRREPNLFWVP